MVVKRHKRPKAPGDDKLGPIRIPDMRECVACKFKPVPVGMNCPNCGRNEIGASGGTPNQSGKSARRVQETEDWPS